MQTTTRATVLAVASAPLLEAGFGSFMAGTDASTETTQEAINRMFANPSAPWALRSKVRAEGRASSAAVATIMAVRSGSPATAASSNKLLAHWRALFVAPYLHV